nr:unnamed protein product [Digitaria exilis]
MGEPSKELLDLPSEPRPPSSFIETNNSSSSRMTRWASASRDSPLTPFPKVKDLLLGVADLHSDQAVDAAEATMNGFQPSGMSFGCSSSDSEEDSDDSDEDGGGDIMSDKGPDEAAADPAERKKPNKRQKIVVLN